MNEFYIESFVQLFWVVVIITAIMIVFYVIFGMIQEKGKETPMKKAPYSGGKGVETRATFFKATFFQYAIYFLIFDVVAFITALATFVSDKSKEHVFYAALYLFLVLILFLILPKQESEII